MRTPPGWKITALLLVIAAHLWLGWSLANYRPDGRLVPSRAREQPSPEEVLLVLEFKTRVAPARTMPTQDARPRRRPQSPRAALEASAAGETGTSVAIVANEPGRPLDLRPAPLPNAKFARPDLLQRAPALSYESTRYDKAWISTGNLTHVVARRSIVANVVLSVLGALREDCTEKDRANYERGCVTDQYEHKPGFE
jgi:hypothetical protein